MWCQTCGYQAHEACCEECIGHTTDERCVTIELLTDDQPIFAGEVAS